MANTNPVQSLAPELESMRKLLQKFGSQQCAELFMEIINLLSEPTSTLESFLQLLLDKLNELIPSSSSLIGLVVGESESNGPKIVVQQGEHRIGALGGRHNRQWPNYPIGGEELAPGQRSLIGYVAFTKQGIVLPDVQEWSKTTGFYREVHEGINSEIAVPILLEDRDVLGVINLESTEKNYYKAEHLYQLEWVACVISRSLDAFMNRAGYRKPYLTILDKIHKDLRGLRINPDLSSKAVKYLSEDSKNIFDIIAGRVATALNSARCEIWIQTKNREKMLLEGQYGTTDLTDAELNLGLDTAKETMEQKSLFSLDFYTSPSGVPTLICPLLVSGRSYGIIRVMSLEPAGKVYRYSLGDERLLEVLQQPISIAIHQKHLEWERRAASFKRQKDVAALLDIIADIDIDLDTLLRRACDQTSQLCGALHCSIFTLDDTTGRFRQAASTNLPERFLNKQYYQPGEGLTGWVGKYGKPLNLRTRLDRDLANIEPPIDWNNAEKKRHKDLINRPFIAVPIQLKGRTVGILRCTDKGGERPIFTEADEQILLLIAAHLATAITLQQHHEGKTKLFRGLKLLLAAVKAQQEVPRQAVIEEHLLNNIRDAARDIFGADSAVLCRSHQVFDTPVESEPLKEEDPFSNLAGDHLLFCQKFNGGESFGFFSDVADHRDLVHAHLSETGQSGQERPGLPEGTSVVARIGSSHFGKALLVLNYGEQPQKFNRQFIELFTAFTDIATLCLDIFDMRLEGMKIATHLHNDIIPELVRDVVAEAGLGAIHIRKRNYVIAEDYFDAIESSAQQSVASLSDIVCQLIRRFTWLSAQPSY